jgi:hypothetical protein
MGLLSRIASSEHAPAKNSDADLVPAPLTDEAGPDASSVEDFVSTYYRDKGPFRGLVLTSEEHGTGLLEALKKILASGRITELSPGVCLMLYPKPLNEKLIVHRLTESFGVKVLLSFEVSSVTEALNHIGNYRKA